MVRSREEVAAILRTQRLEEECLRQYMENEQRQLDAQRRHLERTQALILQDIADRERIEEQRRANQD